MCPFYTKCFSFLKSDDHPDVAVGYISDVILVRLYFCSYSYAVVSLGQPKCGFLPSSRFIADENAIKKNVTRFKMHQFLKLQQRQVIFYYIMYLVLCVLFKIYCLMFINSFLSWCSAHCQVVRPFYSLIFDYFACLDLS